MFTGNPEPEYFTIGEVQNTFGYDGEIKIKVLTDFPERFQLGARIYIGGLEHVIERSHPQQAGFVLKLNGVNTAAAALALLHKQIEIPAGEKKRLPEGKYYLADIIGLEVWTTGGELVGKISDILNTGANDVYVVTHGGQEALIPAVKNVVQSVDLKNRRLVVEAIEGLLD